MTLNEGWYWFGILYNPTHFQTRGSQIPMMDVSVCWSICHPTWLSWHLIYQNVLDFSSKTTACEVNKIVRNVPLEVFKKCCFSEWFKIQHGFPSLWLNETFSTFFLSKATSFEVTRLSIPLGILKKSCYFLEWFEI